jgi:hypothetical protein
VSPVQHRAFGFAHVASIYVDAGNNESVTILNIETWQASVCPGQSVLIRFTLQGCELRSDVAHGRDRRQPNHLPRFADVAQDGCVSWLCPKTGALTLAINR